MVITKGNKNCNKLTETLSLRSYHNHRPDSSFCLKLHKTCGMMEFNHNCLNDIAKCWYPLCELNIKELPKYNHVLPAAATAPIFPTRRAPARRTSWRGTASVAIAIACVVIVAVDLSGTPRLIVTLYLGASVVFYVLVFPLARTLGTYIVPPRFVGHACCVSTPWELGLQKNTVSRGSQNSR